MKKLEELAVQKSFWQKSQSEQNKVLKEISDLKQEKALWTELCVLEQDVEANLELCEEQTDKDLFLELETNIKQFQNKIQSQEILYYLSGSYDKNNGIVHINSGTGGTEAMDWVKMLMRMYLRWGEKQSFQVEVLEGTLGEEAGFKSVTLKMTGKYVYGKLKQEIGIHRLVRISPFDSQKKRHTSFASVYVYPEIADDVKVEIKDTDLRIDTYRSQGAGGQHVNTTDSAVRIVHLPTGIRAQCQNERSQHKNKATAMKILKSALVQKEIEERQKEKDKQEGQKKGISWGNQTRSYVLHPYQMIKDHRSGLENSNAQEVLDGEIDNFIQGNLLNSK